MRAGFAKMPVGNLGRWGSDQDASVEDAHTSLEKTLDLSDQYIAVLSEGQSQLDPKS